MLLERINKLELDIGTAKKSLNYKDNKNEFER